MAVDENISALFGPGVAELARPGLAPTFDVPITAGFVALVDCAPLAVAREKGFAAAEGIDLTLVREPSWANIRDRVVLGHFDAAQMLAPMTIASTLKLAQLDEPLIAPLVLDLGGNAISVSKAVHAAMGAHGSAGDIADPASTGHALKRVIDARQAAGAGLLTFGMTYPFSSHNYELRYWLSAAGIDPDRDIRLVVVPPPLMVDAMATGHVDGFCVGAPWSSLAVEAGVGHIVATTAAMKPFSPEKVLGVRRAWAERYPDRLDRLVRALVTACAWCDDAGNIEELASLLARPDYVDAPAEVIRRSLDHEIIAHPGGDWIAVPDYIRFSGNAANRPRVADALWYATQMVRWGQVGDLNEAIAAAHGTFRSDLYDRALGSGPMDSDAATITLFDGRRFDPAFPAHYLVAPAQRTI